MKEVLEFYKAFAQTFSKNLTLTYDLARRTVISRVSDRKMERVLNEVHQPFTPAQVQLTVHSAFICICNFLNLRYFSLYQLSEVGS